MLSLRIIVDEREKPSGIPDILRELGARVEFRVLDVADYVIGDRAIERKTISDFLASLFSGRLFDQARRLHESYETPLMIVEGNLQESLSRIPRPKAFWGALLSLVLQYDVRAFFTLNAQQTAELILTYGRQVLQRSRRPPPLIVKKPRISSVTQAQLLIVGSLPTIGPKLARKLLERFGTIRKIFRASLSELAVQGGVGRSRAQKITSILDLPYQPAYPQQRQSVLRPEE